MDNNFVCHICSESFQTLKFYTNHYLIHTNISNVLYPCPFKNCNLKFKKYGGLKTHFKSYHQDNIHSNVSSDFKYMHCNVCNKQFSSSKVLVAHVKSHLRSGQFIVCPY